ncbi:MAG: formimidoyltransferase-cyclodeaminase, partial [Acidobacteria bacterium]|nr:formimidoyltransferase-cyclodeaminase [Acidobacteriota bacterium]
QGASMEDCVEISKRLGRRVGDELGIPVYLYAHSASRPERERLPDIREVEYEALETKLADPEFAPDFGPAAFNARAGVTAVGAREFLIAWNVNLNTRSRALAGKIAMELRETGKLKRDAEGKIVRDAERQAVREPGRFEALQGGGWYIEEYGRAQISFNLLNYELTSMHAVFDACCEEAEKLGLRVTGSELVGLVPLDAMLAAGDHYLARQGATVGVPEKERVHSAVLSLGLDDLQPFDPREKIVEYKYRGAPTGLKAMSLIDFVDELSSDSFAPGGGSVAALCGALSAALSAMVAVLTWSKQGMEETRKLMQRTGREAQALKDWYTAAVDADTEAFMSVITARRLPKKTKEEKAARRVAIEIANQEATRVPLGVLERTVEALEMAHTVAKQGNPSAVSDAGVAGACALAAAEGAALNVEINLPSLTDEATAKEIAERRAAALAAARRLAAAVQQTVAAELAG